MHPVIRIASFVLIALLLARAGYTQLLVLAPCFALAYKICNIPFRSALHAVSRLRWFFLSILVLYFWYTPGDPLVVTDTGIEMWLPTVQGVTGGLTRITALILIVAAVHLLLYSTTREQLLAAIYWIAKPLHWLGISRERFAVRVVLVMNAVTQVQDLILASKEHIRGHLKGKGALMHIGQLTAQLLQRITEAAEHAPCEVITLDRPHGPPLVQWLVPAVIVVLYGLLG